MDLTNGRCKVAKELVKGEWHSDEGLQEFGLLLRSSQCGFWARQSLSGSERPIFG
jgi:hypothetical protein